GVESQPEGPHCDETHTRHRHLVIPEPARPTRLDVTDQHEEQRMPESSEGRVAVYIDFDNIVISRYDQKHGRTRGRKPDNLKDITAAALAADPDLVQRLTEATIDIGAVLDFASSFGSITVSRAYADWSVAVNASYRDQL